MKKSKSLALALFALLALMGLLASLHLSARPNPTDGRKSIKIEVVHGDGSTVTMHSVSDAEFLGEVLLNSAWITGEQGPFGLYIIEVDGEKADYAENKSYWALFINGEYATQGADTTPISDGDTFSLVYTIG